MSITQCGQKPKRIKKSLGNHNLRFEPSSTGGSGAGVPDSFWVPLLETHLPVTVKAPRFLSLGAVCGLCKKRLKVETQ